MLPVVDLSDGVGLISSFLDTSGEMGGTAVATKEMTKRIITWYRSVNRLGDSRVGNCL